MSNLSALRPSLPILIGASVMLSLAMGLRQSLGIFMPPLTRDTGISVGDFTLAIAVQNLAWGFLQPLAGAWATRLGMRRLMVGGALLYTLGLVLLATAQGLTGVVLGAGVAIGAALACNGSALAMAAASRPVPVALRSAVLGIVSAAGSLGAMLAAPLGQGLAMEFGWRVGVWGFVALALLMVPAAWVAGRVDALPLPPKPGEGDTARAALGVALRNPMFVVLSVAFFVCGMQLVFLTTHLPSYLDLCGMDPMLGAQALGMIGAFNVLGSLFFGWAGGRWNKLVLLGGIYTLRSLALAWYFMALPTPAEHAGLRRGHGLPVAGRGAAGHRLDRRHLRPQMAGHAGRRGLCRPPARQLRRCLRRRADLRPGRLLHVGLADRSGRGPGRRAGAGRLRLVAW